MPGEAGLPEGPVRVGVKIDRAPDLPLLTGERHRIDLRAPLSNNLEPFGWKSLSNLRIFVEKLHPFHEHHIPSHRGGHPGGGMHGKHLEPVIPFLDPERIVETVLDLQVQVLGELLRGDLSPLHQDLPDLPLLLLLDGENLPELLGGKVSGIHQHVPDQGGRGAPPIGLHVDDQSFRKKEDRLPLVPPDRQGAAFALAGDQLENFRYAEVGDLSLHGLPSFPADLERPLHPSEGPDPPCRPDHPKNSRDKEGIAGDDRLEIGEDVIPSPGADGHRYHCQREAQKNDIYRRPSLFSAP